MSVCSISGQRWDSGKSDTKFCVQSASKPITYAMALEEHSTEYVHQHVGKQPSGRSFNDLVYIYLQSCIWINLFKIKNLNLNLKKINFYIL